MQSIFSGQTLGMNSNEIERNGDAKDQESGDEDDDDDDDIERDETAEVIEPVRQRNQSQTSQKKIIKVKLKASSTRRQGPLISDKDRAAMTHSRLFNLEHAANKPDFEEKVKG